MLWAALCQRIVRALLVDGPSSRELITQPAVKCWNKSILSQSLVLNGDALRIVGTTLRLAGERWPRVRSARVMELYQLLSVHNDLSHMQHSKGMSLRSQFTIGCVASSKEGALVIAARDIEAET